MSLYINVDEVPFGAEPTCEGCGLNGEGPRCNAKRGQKHFCQFTVMQMARTMGRGCRVSALINDMESSLADIYEDLNARGAGDLRAEFREEYERKLRSDINIILDGGYCTATERERAHGWLADEIQNEFDGRVYR